jgi:hypothetical protein
MWLDVNVNASTSSADAAATNARGHSITMSVLPEGLWVPSLAVPASKTVTMMGDALPTVTAAAASVGAAVTVHASRVMN